MEEPKPVRESVELTTKDLIKLVLEHHPSLRMRGGWQADDTTLQIDQAKCVISWVPVAPHP